MTDPLMTDPLMTGPLMTGPLMTGPFVGIRCRTGIGSCPFTARRFRSSFPLPVAPVPRNSFHRRAISKADSFTISLPDRVAAGPRRPAC